MKILTDDHWEFIMEQLSQAQARVKELEGQIAGLLDRLLVEKGQMPLNLQLNERIKDDEKAHNDLMEQLTVEEIGEEPKDASD